MDSDGALHLVEEDLAEQWIADTLADFDRYLGKVVAFQAYLEGELADG